jgi:hypothetical protein
MSFQLINHVRNPFLWTDYDEFLAANVCLHVYSFLIPMWKPCAIYVQSMCKPCANHVQTNMCKPCLLQVGFIHCGVHPRAACWGHSPSGLSRRLDLLYIMASSRVLLDMQPCDRLQWASDAGSQRSVFVGNGSSTWIDRSRTFPFHIHSDSRGCLSVSYSPQQISLGRLRHSGIHFHYGEMGNRQRSAPPTLLGTPSYCSPGSICISQQQQQHTDRRVWTSASQRRVRTILHGDSRSRWAHPYLRLESMCMENGFQTWSHTRSLRSAAGYLPSQTRQAWEHCPWHDHNLTTGSGACPDSSHSLRLDSHSHSHRSTFRVFLHAHAILGFLFLRRRKWRSCPSPPWLATRLNLQLLCARRANLRSWQKREKHWILPPCGEQMGLDASLSRFLWTAAGWASGWSARLPILSQLYEESWSLEKTGTHQHQSGSPPAAQNLYHLTLRWSISGRSLVDLELWYCRHHELASSWGFYIVSVDAAAVTTSCMHACMQAHEIYNTRFITVGRQGLGDGLGNCCCWAGIWWLLLFVVGIWRFSTL